MTRNRQKSDIMPSVFEAGKTVWRVAMSERASFLIDANAFYTSLVEACRNAEQEIFILGWDTDSRTELPIPPDCPPEYLSPAGHLELGYFLAALTRERPGLHVYILTWDFAFIYMLERESLPSFRFTSLESDRIRFVLDRQHPALASHHQKIVVVDRAVAFSGGLDITQRRWDTPEHKSDDPRRIDPGGRKYGPFHDVQFCVDGETAEALGQIARERWLIATGVELPAVNNFRKSHPEPSSESRDKWPLSAEVSMRKVQIAISRTIPQDLNIESSRAVGEVEALFTETLKSVKRFAYIENQYFTSSLIAEVLAARLIEKDGPEIVMILPRDETGWIEESTMGLLRAEALRTVRAADRYNRFRCYYPIVPGLGAGYVKIHSKVMVLDDEFIRIGSANLNGRSMGVDTECDLSVAAGDREDLRQAMRTLRETLLAEHLGVTESEIRHKFSQCKSLVETVESFLGGDRTLIELQAHIPDWVEKIAPPSEWIDPTEPRGIRRWFSAQFFAHRISFILFICLVLASTLGIYATSEELHPWRALQDLNE